MQRWGASAMPPQSGARDAAQRRVPPSYWRSYESRTTWRDLTRARIARETPPIAFESVAASQQDRLLGRDATFARTDGSKHLRTVLEENRCSHNAAR